MTQVKKRKKLKRVTGPKISPHTSTVQTSLPRAPVVAVLGHVDHGKTTLLDKIRHTNIQAQETGGITQHIGAYQIKHNDQPITFIDTPGHAAFVKMRQRGAQVTDLVVLVIAANDGVKPQTKESIRHIQAAQVPLIVAINKMDLPGASPDKVKAQLAESNVIVEDYGGQVVCVETVATSGKGIPQLLEMILLIAQLQSITNQSQAPLKAVVIESKLQPHRGIVASVIVKTGLLRLGDELQAGYLVGKTRALFDHTGQSIQQVKPGEPAEILGFKTLPPVGQVITRKGEEIEKSKKPPLPSKSSPSNPEAKPDESADKPEEESLPAEASAEEERSRIKAILKADTQGTLEAIKANVTEEVEQVGEGVGEVNESDVLLAQATGAKILAFRVKTSKSAQKLADFEKIEIKHYQAIYELLEDLEKQVLKILEPTIDEEIVGEANIAAEFTIKKDHIAGCQVKNGKIELGGNVHLLRADKIVGNAKIRSLKIGPKDIAIAKKGEACGIILRPSLDFQVGDTLQYYRVISN